MKKSKKMVELFDKAKKDLVRYATHNRMEYLIITDEDIELYYEFFLDGMDNAVKALLLQVLGDLSKKAKYKEVVIITNRNISTDMGIENPKLRALLGSFENRVGCWVGSLPYRLYDDGKILFGEESWEFSLIKDLPPIRHESTQ